MGGEWETEEETKKHRSEKDRLKQGAFQQDFQTRTFLNCDVFYDIHEGDYNF